jgi:hypothetical protein
LHPDDTARPASDQLGCAGIAIWPARQEIVLSFVFLQRFNLAYATTIVAILHDGFKVAVPSGTLANPNISLNLAFAIAVRAFNYISHSITLLMNNGMANKAKRNMISAAISSLCFIGGSPFAVRLH